MSHTYSVIDIEDGEIVTQCNDCGAHVINGKKSDVKHHKSCIPGDAERWKEYYSRGDDDTILAPALARELRPKPNNDSFVGLTANTTLFLESLMPLGKYKGELVETIIETDPDYIDWFLCTVNGYILDSLAQQELATVPRLTSSDPDEHEGFELEHPGDLLLAAFIGGGRRH